jgi:hypothetical protein
MLSVGLCGWHINITITILNIIHRPVFYVKETQRFRDCSLSPSSGGAYSDGPNRKSWSLTWTQLCQQYLLLERLHVTKLPKHVNTITVNTQLKDNAHAFSHPDCVTSEKKLTVIQQTTAGWLRGFKGHNILQI